MKLINKLFFGILIALTAISVQALDRTQIADDANDVAPLMTGQQAPDITLFDSEGTPFKLLEKVAEKPTVVIFYRGGWCPFCNAQLSQLQQIEDDLTEMGYQLLAISPDTPTALQKTSKDKELSYELISDFQLTATREFGLAFHIPNEYSDKIESIGGKTARLAGDDKSTLPVPAVFILDKNGMILFQYANPNFKVRIQPELLLTAARLALEGENAVQPEK